MEEYLIPCYSKKLFGIDCFGCGIQRALVMLIQGDFKGALYMYPAIFPMLVFFIFIGIQLIDKNRNYHKIIVSVGILSTITMVCAYFYKLLYY
jgi:hypothetical protein